MTTAKPTLPGDYEVRRAFRGLMWLAIGNLLVAAVLSAVSVATSKLGFSSSAIIRVLGFNLNIALGAVSAGQVHSWAALSAFLPARRFAGLLLSIAFAVAVGAIQWVGFAVRFPESADEHLTSLWAGLLSLGVFAIAQGARIFGGQRLILQFSTVQANGNQLRVADLVEWTVTIGVFFGLGKVVGWVQSPLQLTSIIGVSTLVTLPLALAMVSQGRRRWLWIAVALGLAFAATLVRNLAIWHYLDPTMFMLPKW